MLASVRPRDLAGKTRRRLAAEQLAELVVVEKKIKDLTKERDGAGAWLESREHSQDDLTLW